MKIAVTVDTEADNQWLHGAPLATENVRFWQPFQELCERFEAPPTYLITSEMADDGKATAFLTAAVERGAAEVGGHLHPWTTPPFDDRPGLAYNDPRHAFPCQLDEAMLRAKLQTLTAQIGERFGRAPTSFRAGRFGVNATLARLLAELGYEIDSSVTPFVSWRSTAGMPGREGPDFRHHTVTPFRVAGVRAPGLVELPVTILPTYALLRRFPRLLDLYQTLPARAARRATGRRLRPQPLWLCPFPSHDERDLRSVLREAERQRLTFAVFVLHSSELMPQGSPYRPTAASVNALLGLIEGFLAYARGLGHGFCTLTQAGRELAADGRLPTRPL